MKMKEEWRLLASSGLSKKDLNSLIKRYFYRRDDEDCIRVSFKEDPAPPYKVFQDGIHMDGFRVIVKGGRYRFEGRFE